MKITKRQLRRIIKEEKQKILAENRVRKVVREALLNESIRTSEAERHDERIMDYAKLYGSEKAIDYIVSKKLDPEVGLGAPSFSDPISPALDKERNDILRRIEAGEFSGPKGVIDLLAAMGNEMKEKVGGFYVFRPTAEERQRLIEMEVEENYVEDPGWAKKYDAGIELMLKLHGPEETLDSIYDETNINRDLLTRAAKQNNREVRRGIETGEFSGPSGVIDLLKELSPEVKSHLAVWNATSKWGPQPKTDTKPVSKAAPHPYDASINDAVDAGYFSNSDAVEEVQDHLRSAGAMDLIDEIEDMVQYGDDDIYDVLAMIPKAIKDKLPIG